MKAAISFTALLALSAVAAGVLRSDDGAGAQERGALMKEKLALAQKVFGNLATNDLGAVATDAAAIAALTRDARWRITESPEYLSRSVEFERSSTTLASMAAGGNADGAALAWVQVTTQCLDCHRWLRGVQKRR